MPIIHESWAIRSCIIFFKLFSHSILFADTGLHDNSSYAKKSQFTRIKLLRKRWWRTECSWMTRSQTKWIVVVDLSSFQENKMKWFLLNKSKYKSNLSAYFLISEMLYKWFNTGMIWRSSKILLNILPTSLFFLESERTIKPLVRNGTVFSLQRHQLSLNSWRDNLMWSSCQKWCSSYCWKPQKVR